MLHKYKLNTGTYDKLVITNLFFFQLFLPIRNILALQSRSVCCVAIKSNGIIHTNNTNFTISKRHAVTDFIGINTKSKISEFIDRFQIMNPLNKSVSKHIS